MPNIWIGKNYFASQHRILILGESWYAKDESLTDAINGWINGKTDATFSRIFTSAPDTYLSRLKNEKRLEFWNSVAFYNFVVGSVGPDRTHRPTRLHYERSTPQLKVVLSEYKPKGVWVLGKGQSAFSEGVIAAAGLPYEIVAHPTSYGLKADVRRDSWNRLRSKIDSVI